MKASQRLKELSDSWGDDISFTPAQVLALASLVEAAEKAENHLRMWASGESVLARHMLYDALAALDEELG